MSTTAIPIPAGATIGAPPQAPQKSVPIPEGASVGEPPADSGGFLHEAGEAAENVGIGFAKGAGQTTETVSKVLNKIPGVGEYLAPSEGIRAEHPMMETHGAAQTVGAGLESIGEFVLGDEALKGLSIADKWSVAAKVAKFTEEAPPIVRKALAIGMHAVRGGTIGAVQGAGSAIREGTSVAGGATEGALLGAGAEAAFRAAPAAVDALQGARAARAAVKEQATKDAIKKVLGNKSTADVLDEAGSRLERYRFSNIENDLKLVKPQLDADLKTWEGQLDDVLASAKKPVRQAQSIVGDALHQMLTRATAGDEPERNRAIITVGRRVLAKLGNGPMSAESVNDVKRLVGDEIKNFQPPEMLNSAGKAEQEAYRQAYFTLRDLVSDAEPLSKELNQKISRAFELQDLLEKKFPHLETAGQARLSHQAVRSAAKKGAASAAAVDLMKAGGLYLGGRMLGSALKGD